MTYFRLYSLTGMALNTTESFGRLAFSFNLLSILEIVPHSSAGMPLTRTLAVSLFQPIENRSQAQSLPHTIGQEIPETNGDHQQGTNLLELKNK